MLSGISARGGAFTGQAVEPWVAAVQPGCDQMSPVIVEGNAVSQDQSAKIQAAADRVLELAEEVEASGEATIGGTDLERRLAALRGWIDGVKAVVVNPALGRVTLIHENGRESTISSAELPFLMSVPVKDRPDA